MPAYAEEIEEAIQEGVIIMPLTNPREILVDDKGLIRGVKCNSMTLGEFDNSGRRSPVNSKDTFVVESDQVNSCLGQVLDTSLNHIGTTLSMFG